MTRAQILVLAILAITVCIVFGIAAVAVRAQLQPSDTPLLAKQTETQVPPTPAATATWTIMPTNTHTPTPAQTLTPTSTNTRVVPDTATPTQTHTPAPTPTGTITPTSTRVSGGGYYGGPSPTSTPTSRYLLKMVEEPLEYKTKNFIFVIYARVASGDFLLPGYRLVGVHSPTGANVKSEPSCPHLCRGSGPRVEDWLIQEGNLVFEAFFYDTGSWSLMLVDPQGNQASEVFHVPIDIEDRKWFFYHFNR